MKTLIFLLAAVSAFAQTYSTGTAGCGNNTISCQAIPVSNGKALSFETIGINNGMPFLSPGAYSFGSETGDFTSVEFSGYPNPAPSYKFFYFTMTLDGPQFSTNLLMRGYKGYRGVTNYSTTGGMLTLK